MPYPDQKELLRDLVLQDHVALDDEPLLLAVYYASAAAPDEECLFEVADNFGFNEISGEHRIFQIQFGPTQKFPLPEGDRLRLSLTNPVEFQRAITDRWPEVQDLQEAIVHGQYELMYLCDTDPEAKILLEALQPLSVSMQSVPVAA